MRVIRPGPRLGFQVFLGPGAVMTALYPCPEMSERTTAASVGRVRVGMWTGSAVSEAQNILINSIPVRNIGQPADFASLAAWLLSPHSSFVTGQIYHIDGGVSV